MQEQEYLVALGSNLGSHAGDASQTLVAALQDLAGRGVHLRRVSRFFSTPCFPAGAGPDYVNAAAAVRTYHDAASLLATLHEVEAAFDRERVSRWAARTLDLDLIAAGDGVLPDRETVDHWLTLSPEAQRTVAPDRLILPHPRMAERAFVLIPLADIAPGWRHPVLDRSVAEMRDALGADDVAGVVPL